MNEKASLDTIFCAAIEIDSIEQREAYLNEACGEDDKLRRQLTRLIEAHFRGGTIIDSPPVEPGETAFHPISETSGSTIGRYKLLQQLGEGGMGEVYLAEQTDPVERRVAVKIIKAGMDSRQVIARFEAERQAIAIMDHPGIAKVFDAGTTEAGRPYFVMELVKGVPITQYCDEHRLDPRQRLELFQDVCHAVQHAHQKGIIHRDLKPSNVLVAEYDDHAVPKIIDFGVAKATQQRLTEKTMFTEVGTVVGTIEYMSPEQAKLNQLDIDTRSDIYSLGVLLYELLTGEPPFDRKKLRSAALDEMLRIIREEEPSRPSIKLSTSESLPSIAANRHVEPKKLGTILRGELDWIVMKSLEKDRTRRYETADAFADDIGKYLGDEAVLACPPSAAYRFRKFARRNKLQLSAAAASAVALVALAIGSTLAASRFRSLAEREEELRKESQQQTQIATEALVQAETERERADRNKSLAEERESLARRNLYAAHMNLAQKALENADIPRAKAFLERHVPMPGEKDWRSFEWYYLAGLCNSDELTIDTRHSWSRPEFSPDSTLFAVAIGGQQIELWNVERRQRVQVIKDDSVNGPVAFSPDGRMLASTGNGQLKLWDVGTGRLIRSMPGHAHHVLSIVFTPDGSRVISTDGGNLDKKNIVGIIRVWNSATGDLIHESKGHTAYVHNIAVSPDGSRLVSTGRGSPVLGSSIW